MAKASKTPEPHEWDMTEEEKEQLARIMSDKRALSIMQDSQMPIARVIGEREDNWWDQVMERLGIKRGSTPPVSADYRTGKIHR